MAMWLFTAAIMQSRPVKLFNHGHMRRDFTYMDDVTEAVSRLLTQPPRPDPAVDRAHATRQSAKRLGSSTMSVTVSPWKSTNWWA